MTFLTDTRSELLKTRRTASFWLSILAAGFIPALFFTSYMVNPAGAHKQLAPMPWEMHFMWGWQALNSFLFPMYVVLICSLIPQIEYRNNTWKQVFASPRSTANIFFSKFLTVHLMIFFFFFLFNGFMLLSGVVANAINDQFNFFEKELPWKKLMQLNAKTYISILGISAIQFWLSIRFKNFIAPIGIGLALLVASIIAMNLGWEHIYKMPFAHPILSLKYMMLPNRPFLENHEWNSIGYLFAITLIA